MQRGAASSAYRQGPLSPEETTVGRLIDMIATRYLTGDISQVPEERSEEKSSEPIL